MTDHFETTHHVETATERRAQFHAMTEGTQDDWTIIAAATTEYRLDLPNRVMAHLNLLAGDHGGFAVDRLTHCLQTATRAERNGRSDEYVLCALLHDIGDVLTPYDHPAVAAAMLRGFVSKDLEWMVRHHHAFQGYFYFEYLGLNPDAREKYRDHPMFDTTAEFCAEFDQAAFDPGYDTHPLEHYRPLVEDLMGRASAGREIVVPARRLG